MRCGEDGSIAILTPTVQAQPDGVHINLRVPAGSELGFVVRECCGHNAEEGPFVVPVPPGAMHVGCLTHQQDAGDDSLYREIRVVDELGAYIDVTLSCDNVTGVGASDVGAPAGQEPVAAARALLTGLRPTDELVSIGYVARQSEASVAVRRSGEVVAVLQLESTKGGWGWIGFESCPDSGVSY